MSLCKRWGKWEAGSGMIPGNKTLLPLVQSHDHDHQCRKTPLFNQVQYLNPSKHRNTRQQTPKEHPVNEKVTKPRSEQLRTKGLAERGKRNWPTAFPIITSGLSTVVGKIPSIPSKTLKYPQLFEHQLKNEESTQSPTVDSLLSPTPTRPAPETHCRYPHWKHLL